MNRELSDPCFGCPVYTTCVTAEASVAARLQGLRERAGLVMSASDRLDEVNIAGALAVLNGEITAEEADRAEEQTDAAIAALLGKPLGQLNAESRASILAEFAEVSDLEATLERVNEAGSDQECAGPKLRFRHMLGFMLRDFGIKMVHSPSTREHKLRRLEDEQFRALKNPRLGKTVCGNPSKQAAFKDARKILAIEIR